jgi:hypothetical protein
MRNIEPEVPEKQKSWRGDGLDKFKMDLIF